MNDFRFALRQLWKAPGFSTVAILTLALALGANVAIFSVVKAVLLRPLPYPHPQELVRLYGTQPELAQAPMAPANFLEWEKENHVFSAIAAFVRQNYNLVGNEQPERVRGARVSAVFFQLLGQQPALGRAFTAEDDQPNRERAIILSDNFWRARFAGERSAIGRVVKLNDENYTVVGVMPAGFDFVDSRIQFWTPVRFSDNERATRDTNYIDVCARLLPNVSLTQAQEQMSTLAQRQAREFPGTNDGIGVKIVSLREDLIGKARPILNVLLGAVGFVLLIACANIANLLLVRATARQREMAIRAALGASRSRMLRLLLTESALIAILGGAFGIVLATWGVDLLVAFKPADLPRLAAVGIDRGVLLFTALLSLLTGVAFGLIPAWQASRPDLNDALKESGRGSTGGIRKQRLRRFLVIAEVAVSLVLLIAAGLMIRSFARLLSVDPGFRSDHVLVGVVSLPTQKYPQARAQAAFYERLMENLRGSPSVISAAVTTDLPLSGGDSTGFEIEGRPPSVSENRPLVDYRLISPDYFAVMGMRLLKGRGFSGHDNSSALPAVIINQTLAAHYFPNEDPIGKRIGLSGGPVDWRQIVGVVADVRNYGLDAEVKPEAYIPVLQNEPAYLAAVASNMTVVTRTASDPLSLGQVWRAQVQRLDGNQPVSNLTTMDTLLAESIAQRRFNMFLLAIFAGLALVLAAIGIYGVISYTVAQRSHEMGIRLALGASRYDILRLVVSHSLGTTFAGVGLGLLAAFALTRLMRSLLYDVAPTDPLAFGGLTGLLIFVALLATYLPARRASRVDPIVTLRAE